MKKVILISCISRDFILFRTGLMKKLKEKGFKVIAAAPYDEYSEKIIRKGFDFINLPIDRKSINPISNFILFINIIKIMLKENPDIVIKFTIKPVIYCSLVSYFIKLSIINVITGLGYTFINKNILTVIVKILYKISLKKADRVIFQNKDDLEFFIDNKLTPPKKSVVILSSGVNIKYYKPVKKKKNKYVTFLFIGRILWDKGIKEFVEAGIMAQKELNNIKLQILGGIDKDNPSSVPLEYIKNITHKGFIEYFGDVDDVRPFITQSDVVVLPSYRE